MGSVQSNLWINLTRERHTHTPSSLLFLYTHTHTWYTTISYFYPHNTSSLLWESKSLVCLLMIQSILAKTKSDNTQQSRPKWRVQQSNLWIILTGERERERESHHLHTHGILPSSVSSIHTTHHHRCESKNSCLSYDSLSKNTVW